MPALPYGEAPRLPRLPEHAPLCRITGRFRPPVRPTVPAVKDASQVRNPIDAFVEDELEKRKLAALPEADRRTLLRRVYLDLIGVPPTLEESNRFLADRSPKAYEAAVDRLLEDKRYGERWGRHWMDVWRYSDWYGWRKGNDVRNSHRFMWRWRDWIIESLNSDKGYDRMILEMLAADEIAPTDTNALRATGFLARNYAKYDRNGWMQDAVDHTSLAFLGITAKCARCHDHKYDPLSQEEYYRLRSFFEPYEVRVDRVPGEVDTDKDGLSRIYDAELQRPTYLFIRGDIQMPDTDRKNISFVATDLEIQITTSAKDGSAVGDAYSVTVGAKKLQDILRALPEQAQVTLEAGENRLQAKAGKSRFNLQTLPAEDFPRFPESKEPQARITLQQRELKHLLSMVQYAMAQQDIRYYLNGLLLLMEDNCLRVVATDGHRLAFAFMMLETHQEKNEVILPRKVVLEIARLLADSEEPVVVEILQNRFVLPFQMWSSCPK